MLIYRLLNAYRRYRASSLTSLAVLIVMALIVLPQFSPAKSAAPFEVNQTLNWTQTNQTAFIQTMTMRKLLEQGQRIWAATDGYGAFRTDDNGQNWNEILDGLLRENRGVLTIFLNSTHLFLGTQAGAYRTSLSNLQISPINTGLQFNGSQVGVYSFAALGSTILAGTSSTVYRSTDNGASWTRQQGGIPNSMAIISMLVLGNTVYAGSDYNGVYKSTDGGLTWGPMSEGLMAGRIASLVMMGNNLIAGTGFEGVYRSTNGAESWQKVGSGLTGNATHIHDLNIIGNDLYAATEDGVYRSTDAGGSWLPVKNGLTGKALLGNALLYHDNYLYLSTEGAGMWRAAVGAQPTPTATASPTASPTLSPTPTASPTVSPTIPPTGRVVALQNGSGLPGSVVTLSISLASQGNENTVGLSVNFDSAVLSYQSTAKGSDATSILKNELQAAQGRVGLAATVDQGQSFPAGNRQIATVTFNVVSNTSATSTSLTLGDIPIPRQVVAADASSLTSGTTFVGGSISIQNGYEGDVAPRPTGKNTGTVNLQDFVQIGRFATGLDAPSLGGEYQRADCAPRDVKGDGSVNLADYVQAGRFAIGIDPIATVGGPTGPTTLTSLTSAARLRSHATSSIPIVRRVDAGLGAAESDRQTLQVAVDALGDETAIGWSLNFNPHDWKFVSATMPAGIGRLTANSNLARSGRVGLALTLDPGETLPAGHVAIADVIFERATPGRRSFVVDFGDRPIAREVVDARANAVPGAFNVGRRRDAIEPLALVSSADMTRAELAADSLSTAFGSHLSTETAVADSVPLPNELGGTRIRITDSHGAERWASLIFVSPSQVNYHIPADTAAGVAMIEIISPDGSVSAGVAPINVAAPALFVAGAAGQQFAAALSIHGDEAGNSVYSPVAHFDEASHTWVADPITIGDQNTPTFLVLFGTGLRGSTSTRVFIDGQEVQPDFSGPQGGFTGVDQINLQLPRSLRGHGAVEIVVEAMGDHSNFVRVQVQ